MLQITRTFIAIAMAGLFVIPARGAYEGIFEGEENTRNLAKVTLEYERDRLAPVQGIGCPYITYYTIRLEQPFLIAKNWELATRWDFPGACSNYPSRDNPSGDLEWGLSDLLTQGILIHTASKRWSLLAGLRVYWPTATQDQLGLGKVQMVPIAGLSCNLPELSKGSNFTPIVRYAADVGGYGGRLHISQLQIRPMLNIELPKGFTATLYPSADIIVNLADHNKLFLPFDGMISKTITKNTVLYVEVGIPIIKEFRYYDFKILSGISISL